MSVLRWKRSKATFSFGHGPTTVVYLTRHQGFRYHANSRALYTARYRFKRWLTNTYVGSFRLKANDNELIEYIENHVFSPLELMALQETYGVKRNSKEKA